MGITKHPVFRTNTVCKERPGNIVSIVNGKTWQTLKGKKGRQDDGNTEETLRYQQKYSAIGSSVKTSFQWLFSCVPVAVNNE